MKGTSIALALTGLAFMLAVIWGAPLIRLFRKLKIGKLIRVEGPESHITKMGTPTMGGFMIIVPVLILTVLLNGATLLGLNVLGQSILLPMVVLIAYGLLGALDDWEGIRVPAKVWDARPHQVPDSDADGIVIAYALKFTCTSELYWPEAKVPLSLAAVYSVAYSSLSACPTPST